MYCSFYLNDKISFVDMKFYFGVFVIDFVELVGVVEMWLWILVDLDDIEFVVDKVVFVGMIVIEFVINVLKYVYVEGEEGEIWIVFRCVDEGNVWFVVEDDGVGFVFFMEVKLGSCKMGFGMCIVCFMVDVIGNGINYLMMVRGMVVEVLVFFG